MAYTIEQVNTAIDEVLNYLYSPEIEKVWNTMLDLKLYDAFFAADELLKKYPHVAENMDAYDAFYIFCEDSYELFIEYMKEEGTVDQRKYIGRTSRFYLTDLHENAHYDNGALIYWLLENGNGYPAISIDKTGHMIPEEDLEDRLVASDMEYIASGLLLRDAKIAVFDAVTEYRDIVDFKENQVKYFDEWLADQEEIFKEAA